MQVVCADYCACHMLCYVASEPPPPSFFWSRERTSACPNYRCARAQLGECGAGLWSAGAMASLYEIAVGILLSLLASPAAGKHLCNMRKA